MEHFEITRGQHLSDSVGDQAIGAMVMKESPEEETELSPCFRVDNVFWFGSSGRHGREKHKTRGPGKECAVTQTKSSEREECWSLKTA
jgi:hypothetical protein